MQVQRPDQVVGQEAEQEGRRHHGDQVHGAAPVAITRAAAADARASHQAVDELAVADDDGEEREEEAERHRHVVQDQDTPP